MDRKMVGGLFTLNSSLIAHIKTVGTIWSQNQVQNKKGYGEPRMFPCV